MDRDQEIPEIVGSKDLREVFKEKGRVRGSFFINNVEMHQFEANSIEGLLATINGRSGQTHVDASIDDGYHLVLEARSPAPIMVRAGAAYVDVPPAGGGDAAEQVLQKLKTAADKDQKDGNKNTILEDLGLDAAGDQQNADQPMPGQPAPGMSAEDRKKARYERAAASGAIRGVPQEMARQTYDGPRRVPQGAGMDGGDGQRRFNPITPEDRAPPTIDPASRQNNPDRQKSPVVNSDHQPTYNDPPDRGSSSLMQHPA